MAKKRSEEYNANGEVNDDDFEEEPNFDDPPGYVDDISDSELLEDFLKQRPRETDGVENVIVIDNIPRVAPDRFEKLKAVIAKLIPKQCEVVNAVYPIGEDGQTKGYAFIEFKNSQMAENALRALHNHRLDKQHIFNVNHFTDFERFDKINDNLEIPPAQEFKVQTDLYDFALDKDAYDQYSVATEAHGAVEVSFWLNSLPEPTPLESRKNFTDTFIKWSPLGTYAVTFHKQGVAIWGGKKMERIQKFAHPGTVYVEFSPCENYIVTYGQATHVGKKVTVWDIRTGTERRTFIADSAHTSSFRWSHDDKYVARMGDNSIYLYETPSFYLLDLKHIKIEGIRDFSWSPTDNIIAYWVEERNDIPARVTLLEIPKKREIRNKNLFHVSGCNLHWQKSGDYLCVKVDRYSKVKRDKGFCGEFYNFEIFSMREKEIPVDSVEIREKIEAFAWEPVGNKFAIIHGEQNNANVSFYEVNTNVKPTLVKQLTKKSCTHLFWSPRGKFIVMANLSMGTFEFVDTTNDYIITASPDHFRANEVAWDPTGRYFVTAVPAFKFKDDTGYNMYTFQGRIIRRVPIKNFVQFLFRPRPPTLLSAEKQQEIWKNLKKYYAAFEAKDRQRSTRASKELTEKRANLRKAFDEYRQRRIAEWNEQKNTRLELRNYLDTDNCLDTEEVDEEIIEYLVKEDITPLE